MSKQILGLGAAFLISASLLLVGCNTSVNNKGEQPKNTSFDPNNQPDDNTTQLPPDDVPPSPGA